MRVLDIMDEQQVKVPRLAPMFLVAAIHLVNFLKGLV